MRFVSPVFAGDRVECVSSPTEDGRQLIEAVVAGDGMVSSNVRVARVITVDGATVDCALSACVLLVHPTDRFDGPSSPLDFEPS